MKVPHLNLSLADGDIAPLTVKDASDLAAITDHSVTAKVDFLPDYFAAGEAEKLLASMGERDVFHGVRQADGALIGVIGVHAHIGMELEIGYWFAARVRGQGTASRTVKAVVQHLAGNCPGCAILAECAPTNTSSWNLLRRIGFAPLDRDGKRIGRRVLRWYAEAGARIDVC